MPLKLQAANLPHENDIHRLLTPTESQSHERRASGFTGHLPRV